MKLLFDFFPILLFFIAFKIGESYHPALAIYYATAVAMIASFIQVIAFWIKHRRFEMMHIVTLVCVLFLGGATLLFHKEIFIKWKPTVIYWIFSLVFLATHFFGNKTLIQRLMEEKIVLPPAVWIKLNSSWVIFFILMGAANLYVAYHFSTDTWVNFKLFGSMGITFVFVILQAIYMTRHTKNNLEEK